ncbi:MAG: Purple acid phosphatase [Labilithrix sp.]|nr:Purple acid phosphatase [Labilithrix sp.]
MNRVPRPLPALLASVLAVAGVLLAFDERPAQAAPPAVTIAKGPWIQQVGTTSAVVRVEVAPAAPIRVTLPAGRTIDVTEARVLHSVLVEGLAPATYVPFAVEAGGVTKHGALTTAPADDATAPFHFLAYGDNRSDDVAHAAVVRAMTGVPAPLLVHTGDFVEHGASAAMWQTFFDIEAPLLRERMLLAAVGNHELVDGAGLEYVRYFGPNAWSEPPRALTVEALSGTRRWGNTRFFLLNGMVDYHAGPTRRWLDKALADADEEPGLVWRIVVLHHGPKSSGPHGDNTYLRDAGIPALFTQHKIDLVLSGHDHVYERGDLDGLAYVVTGGGGAPLYRVRKPESTSRRYESVHHFLDVAVAPADLAVTAIRVDGSVLERCRLTKEHRGWDCEPFDGSSPGPSPLRAGASPLPADPPTYGRSRCGCDVVGASGEGSALTGALLALGLFAARRRRPCSSRPSDSPAASD